MSNIKATKTPQISVVIPTYNCLDYLPQALASVAAQQVEDCEVIVADDGSDDGTIAWLKSQSRQVEQLRWIQNNRQGPAAARNRAIAVARGAYIAFLDADDLWHPGKLKAQLAFHQSHPEVVFSFTDYVQVDCQGRNLGKGFAAWEHFNRLLDGVSGYQKLPNAFTTLFVENPVSTSSVMVRRDRLLETSLFDETLPSAEDIDLWLSLARIGQVGFSTDTGVTYLVRPGSESTKFDHRMRALELINQRYLPEALRRNPQAAQRAKARLNAARAQQARAQGAYRKALRKHSLAFWQAPSLCRLKAVLVDCKTCVSQL